MLDIENVHGGCAGWWWGYFEITTLTKKIPFFKILGNIFEKPGKTEKIKLI